MLLKTHLLLKFTSFNIDCMHYVTFMNTFQKCWMQYRNQLFHPKDLSKILQSLLSLNYTCSTAHASSEFVSSWNIWFLSWKILLLIDQILIIWPCVLKISYVHRVYCLEHKLIRNVFVKDTLKFLEEGNSILKMNP